MEANAQAAAIKAILALMFVNSRLLNALAAQGLISPEEVLSIWNGIRFGIDEDCFRKTWDKSRTEINELHSLYNRALKLAREHWCQPVESEFT